MAATEVPEVIPVFPLTGVVLLPGNWLPLHVFEPRYRAMVEDALAGGGHIGMIQPLAPRDDDAPDPEAAPAPDPVLYPVGCAGRIERHERLPDGRFVILLKGVHRFRVREELPSERGYRRVVAGYDEFAGDRGEEGAEIDAAPVVEAIRAFGQARGVEVDLDQLVDLPGRALINGLAVAMPFSPAEKQALLEASGPEERRDLLLSLLEMAYRGGGFAVADDATATN
jgi:Lon protease-like protein